jgi:hypothetical protein
MNKPLPMLDPDRSAQSGTESIIQWVESLEIVLPKLSPMALQSQSFDFYDKSLKPGEPTAAALAAGIMNLPELDQKTAAARRSEWSRSRCVEFLRFEAARLNVELVQIAEKTKSEAVKVAVIDAIYGAILSNYPHLKAEAADMSARQKLKLTKGGQNGAATARQTPEPQIIAPEAPKAALAGVADVELVQRQATQMANLILVCLREVNEHLVPQAQAAGITLDAAAQHAWTMNMVISLSNGSKSHWKMPTEREQIK